MNKDQVFEMANMVLPDGTKLDLFQAIVDGQKKIDVRAATEKYLNLRIGDIVTFKRLSNGQITQRRIIMISDVGRDVAELLFWVVKDCGIMPKNGLSSVNRACSMIIPGIDSLKDLEQCLNQFPGYPEKIKQHGLIAFALEEVKNE